MKKETSVLECKSKNLSSKLSYTFYITGALITVQDLQVRRINATVTYKVQRPPPDSTPAIPPP